MDQTQHDEAVDALVEEFDQLVRSDALIGGAGDFLADAERVVRSIHDTGVTPVPRDPFKGRAPEPVPDPGLFYTMFWRMFDKTPASMVQSLARFTAADDVFDRAASSPGGSSNVAAKESSSITACSSRTAPTSRSGTTR